MDLEFTFTTELWLYPAKAAWTFATLPVDAAEQIKFFTQTRRGFGSVKVAARIGETEWKTSIFPDSKSGSFLLPVKAAVRKAEGIEVGDEIEIKVSVVTEY